MEPKTGTPRWTCSKVTVVPYAVAIGAVCSQLFRRGAEGGGVLGDVVAGLVDRTRHRQRRVGGAEVAGPRDPDEPHLAGAGSGVMATGPWAWSFICWTRLSPGPGAVRAATAWLAGTAARPAQRSARQLAG